MSNVATTQTQTEEKTPTKIEVSTPMEFEANVKSLFANTVELTKIVDSLFGPAMRDYIGCKISYNNGDLATKFPRSTEYIPMNKFYVSLYFKDRSSVSEKCPINNVTLRSAKFKSASKFDKLVMCSGAAAGRMYDITPETYEALDEFRFTRPGRCDWSKLSYEVLSSFGFSTSMNQEIVACVTGLDLEKIINKVYGSRTDEGIYQYQAIPAQIVANSNGEYVVQVTQLDVSKLDELRKSLGGPIVPPEFHQYVR